MRKNDVEMCSIIDTEPIKESKNVETMETSNSGEVNRRRTRITSSRTPATNEGSKKSRSSKAGKVINTQYAHVRKVPAANSQVVSVIKSGDEVEILDKTDGFYEVKTSSGDLGFIPSTYLKEV